MMNSLVQETLIKDIHNQALIWWFDILLEEHGTLQFLVTVDRRSFPAYPSKLLDVTVTSAK
jgi:hypothetical protein